MADEPFYIPGHKPAAPRQRRPGELLFTFRTTDHKQVDCELRDHGAYGVEAQFWIDREFRYGRRFDTRTLAAQWAEEERKALEKGDA